MKIIAITAFFLGLSSPLLRRGEPAGDAPGLPERSLAALDAPAVLEKFSKVLEGLLGEWGWTSEVVGDKLTVSHSQGETPRAIFDVAFTEIILEASRPPTIYVSVSNHPDSSTDTRFAHFIGSRLLFRRTFNSALMEHLSSWILPIAHRFKTTYDRYTAASDIAKVTVQIKSAFSKHFGGVLKTTEVFSSPQTYIVDAALSANPKLKVRVTVIKLPGSYFKIEITETVNSWVMYTNSITMDRFEMLFSTQLMTIVANRPNNVAEIPDIGQAVKDQIGRACGSSQLPFKDIQVGEAHGAFKVTPPSNLECPFSGAVVIYTRHEQAQLQIIDLMIDSTHQQSEYFLPLDLRTLAPTVGQPVDEVLAAEQLIRKSLVSKKTEQTLTEVELEEWLKKIFREEPEELQISDEKRGVLETEETKIFRAWRYPAKDFEVLVLLNPEGFLVNLESTSRRSSLQVSLPSLNGYDQFQLLSSQISQFLRPSSQISQFLT